MTLTAKNIKKSLGFTLIEILIGIVISTIMMAAMFTTYNVVNNSYSQVSDVASISRAGRDVVSMMMRDVRMAGFKYYYGVFEGSQEDIPAQDFLEYKTGDTEDTKYESHAPIIIYKDTLNYKEITGYAGTPKGVTSDQKLSGKDAEDTKSLSLCCDRIHIVYGDFDANTDQKYKKYRISYFALPMQKMSGSGEDAIITDRYYAIYRSKQSWQQAIGDEDGKWITESNNFCPDCYAAELMREYLVDMEFIALDKYGEKINTDPAEDHSKLYDIRSVDIKLTFRSSSPKGYFKRKIKNVVKSFDDDRMTSIEDSFHRESIFVTVHTRNIGEVL